MGACHASLGHVERRCRWRSSKFEPWIRTRAWKYIYTTLKSNIRWISVMLAYAQKLIVDTRVFEGRYRIFVRLQKHWVRRWGEREKGLFFTQRKFCRCRCMIFKPTKKNSINTWLTTGVGSLRSMVIINKVVHEIVSFAGAADIIADYFATVRRITVWFWMGNQTSLRFTELRKNGWHKWPGLRDATMRVCAFRMRFDFSGASVSMQ
jgi:hypothetical protein